MVADAQGPGLIGEIVSRQTERRVSIAIRRRIELDRFCHGGEA
jgi:hypothetical protein